METMIVARPSWLQVSWTGRTANFYDGVNGHNHVLYSVQLEEARFFGTDRLEKWPSEKYLEAVKVIHSVVETDDLRKLATTINGAVKIACQPA